jgi:hypothetical protein
LALDRNFLKANTIIRTFDQLPKSVGSFLALDQIFRSTEKSQKIRSTENETFDQLKKDNFDQVKFGLMTPVTYFKN